MLRRYAMAALLAACQQAAPPPTDNRPNDAPPPQDAVQPAQQAPAEQPAVEPSAPARVAAIPWGHAVRWRAWDEGLALARSEERPLCLLVYADWCERCRELSPVFDRSDVAEAARGLVMVRQNHDEAPAWLTERFGRYGKYVPRLFFLRPDGSVREDLSSGHPRYPYFYAPLVANQLLQNMRRAVDG